MKRSVLVGAIGGITLSIPFIYANFLPYLGKENMLLFVIFWGVVIVAGTLLYKNHFAKKAIFRTLVMFITCIFTTRFFAIVGLTGVVSDILHVAYIEATDRAEGLGMAFFLIITFAESMIISGTLFIISIFSKIKKTVDGSAP